MRYKYMFNKMKIQYYIYRRRASLMESDTKRHEKYLKINIQIVKIMYSCFFVARAVTPEDSTVTAAAAGVVHDEIYHELEALLLQ